MICEGIDATTVVIDQVGYHVNQAVADELMQMSSEVDRLKRENSQLHWEVVNAKRERDVAEDRYEALRARNTSPGGS